MNGPTAQEPGTEQELERFEQRARALAVQRPDDVAAWDELLLKLRSSGLREAPPPLDPDEARTSRVELLWLIDALRPRPFVRQGTPPAELVTGATTRAGYLIEGQPGIHDALVRPVFAEALARRLPLARLREDFPDLWAVDFTLWEKLVTGPVDCRTLAHAWLVSSGRRLVQELSALRFDPAAPRQGASLLSAEALHEAAGPLLPESEGLREGFADWRELHLAVPGQSFANWSPAREDVAAVLLILVGRRGDPIFLRGAALAWLLDRAARHPHYLMDGMERDLREDLVPALLAAFPLTATAQPEDTPHAELRAAVRLETAALHHAVRLAGLEAKDEKALLARGWSLARWLQGCAFRSPFFGGDEESLAARLRALLPAEPAEVAEDADILHPSRFRDDGTGLDLAELALVAGAAWHYQPEDAPETSSPRLFPTPLPLVKALRRVAARGLNPQERQAEDVLRAWQDAVDSQPSAGPVKGNALGWTAHHIAPPLVARWLMTLHRIAWLQHVEDPARCESVELFRTEPWRYRWVALAFYAEGPELPLPARQEAAMAWRAVKGTDPQVDMYLALMAAGILDALSDEERGGLAALASRARVDWRHRSLEALASAAERWRHDSVWRDAVGALLEMMDDERLETQERMKAALLALKRLSADSGQERRGFLARLAKRAEQPPFNHNVALRRELRRLGVVSAGPRGGL